MNDLKTFQHPILLLRLEEFEIVNIIVLTIILSQVDCRQPLATGNADMLHDEQRKTSNLVKCNEDSINDWTFLQPST